MSYGINRWAYFRERKAPLQQLHSKKGGGWGWAYFWDYGNIIQPAADSCRGSIHFRTQDPWVQCFVDKTTHFSFSVCDISLLPAPDSYRCPGVCVVQIRRLWLQLRWPDCLMKLVSISVLFHQCTCSLPHRCPDVALQIHRLWFSVQSNFSVVSSILYHCKSLVTTGTHWL